MKRESIKGFTAGVLVVALIFIMTITAFGTVATQTITAYYNDIKIYVNDNMIEPMDANEKIVEPFIYDGTTYLPARAVAEALGKNVRWDKSTYSVYIEEPGNEVSAILIYNWEDMYNIRNGLGKNYILMKDLDETSHGYDMYADSMVDGGRGWLPIGTMDDPHTGRFFGNGHVISGLYIDRPDTDFVGLFGYSKGGMFANIGVIDAYVVGGNYTGGLVGRAFYNSLITSCYSSGSVSGIEHVGGLIGGTSGDKVNKDPSVGAEVSNCHSSCTVIGTDPEIGYVGGLSGALGFNGVMTDCYATGNVNGVLRVGGLVGASGYGSKITGSYATGNVIGTNNFVGGLLGGIGFGVEISKCYATGDITGNNAVGGLIGNVTNEKTEKSVGINDCYATGNVTGVGAVGGLAGRTFKNITITNCYASGAVTGSMNFGGMVGAKDDTAIVVDSYWDKDTSGQMESALGEGLSTEEMLMESTYDSWDLVEIWMMEKDVSYPSLKWEMDK